jgi:hypothetical protein
MFILVATVVVLSTVTVANLLLTVSIVRRMRSEAAEADEPVHRPDR